MPRLHGLVGMKNSDIQRAFEFATKFGPMYKQRSKDILQKVQDEIASKHVGTRSAARCLYMVPMSQAEANNIASRAVTFAGANSDAETKATIAEAQKLADQAKHMKYYVNSLRLLCRVEEEIALEVDSFHAVLDILDWADAEPEFEG